VVGLAGYILVAWGLAEHPPSESDWWIIAGLSGLAVLLGITEARMLTGIAVSLEAAAYYTAMVLVGPWGAGLVAIFPILRWRITDRHASNWNLFRSGGMYALMVIAGGLVYQALGGEIPLKFLTAQNLLALAAALAMVRFINELILFGRNFLSRGWDHAMRELIDVQRAAWEVEALAFLPALLTAVIGTRIGWGGLVIWLLVLTAGAFALYLLVRARTEVTGRLDELSAANAHMTEHSQLEAEMAGRLSQASEELAGFASRLAAVLHQQHTAVTQITATVEELTQQAHYIADAAGAVDSTSEAALATAGRGQEAAAGSVMAMEELERNVREMNARMGTLEARSRLIHRTLQTINNIASETHLLALNATIEAAGAGERGRRFSVVAGQINALADQALRAANEIQVTVREIEAATADTKTVIERGLVETRRYTGQVDEARRAMEVILSAVGRASDMAQQIRLATPQLTVASRQVTDAMREIATSLGTASSEGSAVYVAAENLRRLADDLRRLDTHQPAGVGSE
jgi:methyl-accepting chemotaxis protein